MSSELVQKVEQLGKAVTSLTEFNRDLHKALKEISSPVVDLSAVKLPDLSAVEAKLEAIGELIAEQDEKINKIGELLFKFISDMSADVKQPAEDEPKKQSNSKR